MMLAYLERPQAWMDNYNIPESGNGVPDLLDEAKWGIEHLLRMQQKDGSVIAVAALAGASPPSSATGTTYYGGINTISATSSAAAFAIAAGVYRSLGQTAFADTLVKRAKLAWDWSAANPNVLWRNNESQNGSQGIGAGQQETDDYGRTAGSIKAAIFLYDATKTAIAKEAALGYVHYLHGTNPLGITYLTNMNSLGAENSANELYHTWFTDKSAKWDRVGTSTYGPAPGFLTGGPNPSYDLDGCCATNSCGGAGNNALCTSENITPPKGQPKQKSYKDFNTNWPLNSWSITENSNGYQLAYIRMLSKFVSVPSIPTSVEDAEQENALSFELYPNPTTGSFWVSTSFAANQVIVLDISGAVVKTISMEKGQKEINLTELPSGSYFVKVSFGDQVLVKPLIKM